VTERTGGVPLFIEEVTRLLLERGQQGDIQAKALSFARRWRWRNFIRARTAPPMPMPSLRLRLKGSRRRLNFPRLPKRKRCSPRCRYEGPRELAAMSMARLWVQQAREQLAPVLQMTP
jgi:hypothetical protein